MLDFTIICIGRAIFGVSAGILLTIVPKILEDTIPGHLMNKGYGASTSIGINLMVAINSIIGLAVPTSP